MTDPVLPGPLDGFRVEMTPGASVPMCSSIGCRSTS
jgi:hypothetical protein